MIFLRFHSEGYRIILRRCGLLHYSTKIVGCQYVSYMLMRSWHMPPFIKGKLIDIHKPYGEYAKAKLD